MSIEFRLPALRKEIVDALPTASDDLPALSSLHPTSTGSARDFAERSLATLRHLADTQTHAAAALTVLGDRATAAPDIFSDLWARMTMNMPADLYRLAVVADGELNTQEAIVALAVLAGQEEGAYRGFLGLSVMAARLGRPDEAMILATWCMNTGERHPRAFSIAGICALERGDKASGQTYLAAASRIGRRRPDLRTELQRAQRVLLLMHLS